MDFENPRKRTSTTSLSAESEAEDRKKTCHLPVEIILEILRYLPSSRPSTQTTLHTVCLLNSQWYNAAVAKLYSQPYITGRNFALFVRTICPSINAHIKKSDLATLVHVLDLSRLIHHSNKSTTARLLGRVKTNLTWLRAPASSFGLNCFAALSKCEKLEILDLSLVNDAISMYSLSQSLKKLPNVTKLVLPRSGLRVEDFNPSNMVLPPKLAQITLQGGLTSSFLRRLVRPFVSLPSDSMELSIVHCPQVTLSGIYDLVTPIANRLRYLRFANLPLLGTYRSDPHLDKILTLCESLEELSVSIDYVTWLLVFPIPSYYSHVLSATIPSADYRTTVLDFSERSAARTLEPPFPLRTLELTGPAMSKADPDLLMRPRVLVDAVQIGRLTNLRRVEVASSCGWSQTKFIHEMGELVKALAERMQHDDKAGIPRDEIDGGLYSFDG